MDKATRENQKQIRQQKYVADKKIWSKVPPKKITREQAGQARIQSSRREIIDG